MIPQREGPEHQSQSCFHAGDPGCVAAVPSNPNAAHTSQPAPLYSVQEQILRHLELSRHPRLDQQAWGRGPSPAPSAVLREPGGDRIACAGPEPGWTQPPLTATVPHQPHPGRDPATCPASPAWLLPAPRWPPPSTCSPPGPLWLLCQASAASPEWAASDLLWVLCVSLAP